MTVNALFQFLVDLFLLLQFLLRDGCQVGQFGHLDLVGHVRGIALSEHFDSIEELVIGADLVSESFTVSLVEYIDLLCLTLQVNVLLHRLVDRIFDLSALN